jgi:hypothetical protein
MSLSYKVEVIADSSGKFVGNMLRFATRKEAKGYGGDLMSRWLLVENYRVVESDDPVNYEWKEDKLVSKE